MTRIIPIAICIFVLHAARVQAGIVTLYDGTGLPAAQPWLAYADNGFLSGGTATQTPVAGGVNLTTDDAVSAGYGNYFGTALKAPAFPALDRTKGFELTFSAQVLSENHSSPDRAGFSVILLGSDLRGIELGFWESEIWAQDAPGFTHGAGLAIDTTVAREYQLRIVGDDFTLLSGTNPPLTGAVQDYSASGLPYSLPNFLFFGDDTSSARASTVLGSIVLNSDLSAVPEPSLAGLALLGLGLLPLSRHRKP